MDAFDKLVSGMSRDELQKCAGELLIILGGEPYMRRADPQPPGGDMETELPEGPWIMAGAYTKRLEALKAQILELSARNQHAPEAGGMDKAGTEETGGAARGAGAEFLTAGRSAAPKTAWGAAQAAAVRAAGTRKYENALGTRGFEMRRVSDYFRRDSRRYDTGYERY